MKNLTLKIPFRSAEHAVMTLNFASGRNLVRQFFPTLVHGTSLDNAHGESFDPDAEPPLALIIEAAAADGRRVAIRIPCDDSDVAEVSISE